MSAAEILLVGDRKAVFVAHEIEVFPGYVRAAGRFRSRYGSADAPTYSWGDACERCWPWHRIHEVRRDGEVAA